jgi:hypothetical protein
MFEFLNTTDPKANRNRLVLLLVVVLILGMIGGATMNRRPAEPTTDAKTVTQTETKTPQSCLDYIEHSETAFGYAEETITYTGDALEGVSNFDVAAIEEASEKLKAVKPKLEALTPKIVEAKADCKAGK